MDTIKELIQLSALLSEANILLADYHSSIKYGQKSLSLTDEERAAKPPMSSSTRDWLINRNEDTLQKLDKFICRSYKFLNIEDCNIGEQKIVTQELDEKSRKAIAFLLSKEKLLDKVYDMSQKEIEFDKPLTVENGKVV